jgi:hypothetical protein
LIKGNVSESFMVFHKEARVTVQKWLFIVGFNVDRCLGRKISGYRCCSWRRFRRRFVPFSDFNVGICVRVHFGIGIFIIVDYRKAILCWMLEETSNKSLESGVT